MLFKQHIIYNISSEFAFRFSVRIFLSVSVVPLSWNVMYDDELINGICVFVIVVYMEVESKVNTFIIYI